LADPHATAKYARTHTKIHAHTHKKKTSRNSKIKGDRGKKGGGGQGRQKKKRKRINIKRGKRGKRGKRKKKWGGGQEGDGFRGLEERGY